MKPWKYLDSGPVPGNGGTMELLRRDTEYAIRVDGQHLMGTRMHGSEDALAELAFSQLQNTSTTRILVGGLGMGFTLAATLKGLPSKGEAVVAELVPCIIEWNRGELGNAAGRPLEDPRTRVHEGDIVQLIGRSDKEWDAILLDVDNGPSGLTHNNNNALYSAKGLTTARKALKPGGILGVWSAFPDDNFTRVFEKSGFKVMVHKVRARQIKRGHRHIVWTGQRT
ncbi:MAG: hypothetical protein VYA34_06475 [Myxococcota bacterium]|nr:hypothetical protein [Myxococcota bacterium]